MNSIISKIVIILISFNFIVADELKEKFEFDRSYTTPLVINDDYLVTECVYKVKYLDTYNNLKRINHLYIPLPDKTKCPIPYTTSFFISLAYKDLMYKNTPINIKLSNHMTKKLIATNNLKMCLKKNNSEIKCINEQAVINDLKEQEISLRNSLYNVLIDRAKELYIQNMNGIRLPDYLYDYDF